jgi:Flp pilus assembly pilin Flp
MTKTIFTHASRALRALRGNRGQSLVEYALILSFLSALAVALCSIMGTQIHGLLAHIVQAIQAASAGV